jgi:hypothetical protein
MNGAITSASPICYSGMNKENFFVFSSFVSSVVPPLPTWPCPTPQYKVHKWTRQSQVTMLLTEIYINVDTQKVFA